MAFRYNQGIHVGRISSLGVCYYLPDLDPYLPSTWKSPKEYNVDLAWGRIQLSIRSILRVGYKSRLHGMVSVNQQSITASITHQKQLTSLRKKRKTIMKSSFTTVAGIMTALLSTSLVSLLQATPKQSASELKERQFLDGLLIAPITGAGQGLLNSFLGPEQP